LPIININNKDWQKYTLKEESSSTSIFKIIGYITLALVAIAIIFFIIHAIRKRNPDSNKIEANNKVVY
jgi:hypothetical protein